MPKPRTKRTAAPAPVLGPEAGPTLGELVEQLGLVGKLSQSTRQVITESNALAVEHVRVHLTVISCFTCTAPKTCCSRMVGAYLYEAVPIVARLVRDGRDTPELRGQLRAAAHALETGRKATYARPCVFLDADERCSIYEDRPSICGTSLVTSPAEACSAPGASKIEKIVTPLQRTVPPQLADQFSALVGLRPIGTNYYGALSRVVLLCLEAWSRRDYVTFLAERALPAAHCYVRAVQ